MYYRTWCSALVVLAVVVWSWDASCVHCVKVTVRHLQVLMHCHLYYWALEKIIQKTSVQYNEGLTPPYTVIRFSDFTFFVNSFYVHITFYS